MARTVAAVKLAVAEKHIKYTTLSKKRKIVKLNFLEKKKYALANGSKKDKIKVIFLIDF